MALGAETGFPIPLEERGRHPERVVMLNAEINDRCAYSRHHCGATCILNQLGSGARPEFSDQVWKSFAEESCRSGATIENLAIVGKEPTETPERLQAFLESYYASNPAAKPLRIGMITAGTNLDAVEELFFRFPLDWMLTSVDAPETGLRSHQQPRNALRSAIRLKRQGGIRELGIASVMDSRNLTGLTEIGELILAEDTIDHWALTPMLRGGQGRLEPMLKFDELQELVGRLIHQFGQGSKPILINLDFNDLIKLIGGREALDDSLGFWRVEHGIAKSNVKLVAMNPRPGFFLRFRYFGMLADRREFHENAGFSGRFGSFTEGRLSHALNCLTRERDECLSMEATP